MRILFDENISFRILRKVKRHFPESLHVSNANLLATRDINIFEFAKQNDYAIVTFDEDYHALSVLRGFPPKVIWIRTGNLPTNKLADLLISQKSAIMHFLSSDWDEDYGCLELSL